MTVWYVHRREDGEIASAHGEPQEDYATEALDDEVDQEIINWFAKIKSPPLTPAQKLEAAGLTIADLKSLLGLT